MKNINMDPERIEMYHNYYLRAKYAIEKMGLDVVLFDEHEGKMITIDNFSMILTENVIVIFVDGRRVFYFDPDEVEIESIDGGWMQIVDVLCQTALDVEADKKLIR